MHLLLRKGNILEEAHAVVLFGSTCRKISPIEGNANVVIKKIDV